MSVIEVQKRHGHMLVTFSDGQSLRVPFALFRERRVQVGEGVECEAYATWLSSREHAHALDRAVKFLSLRERSTRETRECLVKAGFSEPCIVSVITLLCQRGLLCDERFAGMWVNARAGKLGTRRIERELRGKGVDQQTAQDAIAAVDEREQLENAIAYAKKVLSRKGGKTPPEARALQALLRRGYELQTAKRAIAAALDGDEIFDFEDD